MRLKPEVLLALFAVLGAACAPPHGEPCGALNQLCCAQASCEDGLSCVEGFCAQAHEIRDIGLPCNTSDPGVCESGLCMAGTTGTQPISPSAQVTISINGQPLPDGVCTQRCQTSSDCVPGWSCEGTESGRQCTCKPSAEICDGKDNDCDGVVDDSPVADEDCQKQGSGYACQEGSCLCASTLCGGCVDLHIDTANCGACGNACTASSGATPWCAGGTCAELTTLLSGQAGPLFFAADESSVYFAGTDGIEKIPPTGGTPVSIATAPGIILSAVSDGANLYAGTVSPGAIFSVPVNGGTPTQLAADQSPSFGITTDEANVYWTAGFVASLGFSSWADDGQVLKVPKSGAGPVTVLASGQSAPWGIVVSGGSLYWAEYGTGAIMSVSVNGGQPILIQGGQAGPTALTTDGTYLYWTNDGTAFDSTSLSSTILSVLPMPDASIVKKPLAGGDPVTLASGLQSPGWGIAVDGTNVYWLSSAGPFVPTGTGAVLSVPINGGTPVTLAPNQVHPWGLALSQSRLIWSVGVNDYAAGNGIPSGATLFDAGILSLKLK